MSDSNKFVNTYIEVAVGTVHELLNQVLQLKTEARITSDLVSEKDQVISTLQSALENEQERSRIEHEEADKANQQVRQWEDEVNSLRTKAGNFDALSNQFNELKRDFIAKNTELENIKKDLEEARSKLKELQKIDRQVKKEEKKSQTVDEKPVINKETTPVVKPVVLPTKVVVKEAEEDNDF